MESKKPNILNGVVEDLPTTFDISGPDGKSYRVYNGISGLYISENKPMGPIDGSKKKPTIGIGCKVLSVFGWGLAAFVSLLFLAMVILFIVCLCNV